MGASHARFLQYLPAGGLILDAGCGSGRDSRAFLQAGYSVSAFDACGALCKEARQFSGLAVAHQRFLDPLPVTGVDGIWACASLLHVPRSDLVLTLAHLTAALVSGGVLYASFKWGWGERVDADGRHFTDLDLTELARLLDSLPHLQLVEYWQNTEVRSAHSVNWFNFIVMRAS